MFSAGEVAGRQRWSTADVEPRRAFTYWAETVFGSQLEIESPARAHFCGQVDLAQLGPARLFVVAADTQLVRRTWARVARKHVPGYMLVHLRSGRLRFQQYGREACIGPGDSLLIDMDTPFAMDCLTRTRTVAMHFHQGWLQNWIPAPQTLVARALPGDSGWSAALGAALGSLDSGGEPIDLPIPAGAVAEQIAALLALAAGPQVHASTASEKLFHRVQRTLRDHCHESGLDPETVAGLHGISKRYLHQLCARASTTFGLELMRMRLALAHRLMSDRRYDSLSVSEVATQCGFVEPSHFARRFRKAYGLAPAQFRAARAGAN